jgi:colicin import membrane protein
MSSGEMARYIFAIQRKIEQNWIRPASAVPGLECVINVRQVPGGEVIGATIESCNGDAAVQRSIEAAVFKASPLPEPDNPTLFDRNLRIIFKPEQ